MNNKILLKEIKLPVVDFSGRKIIHTTIYCLTDKRCSRDELEDMTTELEHYDEYLGITFVDRELFFDERTRERVEGYNHDIEYKSLLTIIDECEHRLIGKWRNQQTLEYARQYIITEIQKQGISVIDFEVTFIEDDEREESDGTHLIRVDFNDTTFKNISNLL